MLISLVSIKQISLWTQGIVLKFKQIFGDIHLEKTTLRPLSEGLIRLLKVGDQSFKVSMRLNKVGYTAELSRAIGKEQS